MAVTISDVAAASGVSKGAVSLALNGQPGVGADTRQRIIDAARDLGWTPSLRARGLKSAKSYALGLVLARDPRLLGTDAFFSAFIAGIESALAEHDYALILTVTPNPEAEERSYRKLAGGGRVDGVILTDLRSDDSRFALLEQLGLPAVTLNRPEAGSPFPSVLMDESDGVRSAVGHLLDLGHTRIAHVGGTQQYIHGRSRREAWARTVRAAGHEADLFVEADFTAEGGIEATRHLLGLADPPTAIVFANDLMATAGQSWAQQHGISVPRDLSIAGYDNAEFGRYLNPPLTTISAEPLEWGRAATELLLAVLDGVTSADDVVLPPPSLIVRESTGPVPARSS